jgi:hypothetical protein
LAKIVPGEKRMLTGWIVHVLALGGAAALLLFGWLS